MKNPLDDLPKLGTEAMTPCVSCGRQLLEAGLPLFLRFTAKTCGIDSRALQERMGLAQIMGGFDALSIADVLSSRDPVVVMDQAAEFNVCHDCAQRGTLSPQILVAMAIERQDEPKEAADG